MKFIHALSMLLLTSPAFAEAAGSQAMRRSIGNSDLRHQCPADVTGTRSYR